MKRLLRKFQSHPDVAASALRASSDMPDSGFTFVNNSQGASAAASELSAILGDVMEMIDLDGDVSEQLRLLVHRLDREASKYDNSKLEDAELDSQWDCSRSKAQLISIAWTCSLGAYDPVARVDAVDYCVFEKDHVVLPSATGTVKALTTTTIVTCSPNDLQPDNEFLPVLIVAIRGSASKVDHMVNANAEPKSIRPFIDPLCLGIESSETGQAMAHAGFLNSAEALDPIVFQRVERYVSRKQGIRCHVLFTGHSAGGAVASLLFLRYVSRPEFKSSVHFSCITFGAPPSITVPFEFHAGTDPRVCLNLINEFDIVTRADRLYIVSLVNLFRSIYALPALPYDDGTSRENRRLATYTKKVSESHTEAALSYSTNNSEASEGNNWPVPPMLYHHIGVRIVLLMRLQHSDSPNTLQLKAVEVPSSLFERLLFVRVFVHSRLSYSERVGLILDGTFNDKNGWSG